MKNACPCCGYLTFEEGPPGTFQICPVCGWEDDELQFRDPALEGGANSVSLIQARANFLAIGAIDQEGLRSVRKPFPEEEPISVGTTAFMNALLALLESVLAGSASYLELQRHIDSAAAEDSLPDDLPNGILQTIFDLQTDLELIAENQATNAGTRSMFSKAEIVERLRIYEERLSLNYLNKKKHYRQQ